MVIVEYCRYGNLSNYLKSKRDLFFLNKVRICLSFCCCGLCVLIPAHHWGKSGQEPQQEGQRRAAYRLTSPFSCGLRA